MNYRLLQIDHSPRFFFHIITDLFLQDSEFKETEILILSQTRRYYPNSQIQ